MIKKVVWVLVAAIVFTTIGLVVFVGLWDKDVRMALVAPDSEVPLDWQQQIRSFSNIPTELRSFQTDSTRDGNAAEFLLRDDLAGRLGEFDRVYRLVSRGSAIGVTDSAAFVAVLADSVLDTALIVSRMGVYNSAPIIEGTSGGQSVLSIVTPDLVAAERVVTSLLLRSFAHGRAGATDSAVVDVAAALRLGEMMYEQGTTLVETIIGRRLVDLSVRQLAAIGVATGDSALAARSRSIGQWSGAAPAYNSLILGLGRDRATTVALVRDTDILPAWRAEGISQLVFMEFRPKNVPLGISGSVRSQISGMRQITDPRVAWMAGLAENTVGGFNALGIGGRVDFLRGVF